MSDHSLKELDVTNFRSIRGHVHAPLDAQVVLIHGENGAGKTSLLSAIELALTGSVHSLYRADQNYTRQLLHRSASRGGVLLRTVKQGEEQSFETTLDVVGAHPITTLDDRLATFFSERAYLPQSLLGQLLEIYQESGSDADSPLAKFVGKLLGLDQLDALEAGLKPLVDVRNVRKIVDGWAATETEKTRLDRLLESQRRTRIEIIERLNASLTTLDTLCQSLELGVEVREETLDKVTKTLSEADETEAFQRLTDQARLLDSIRREIEQARSLSESALPTPDTSIASAAYQAWYEENGERVAKMRSRIEALLPTVSLPSDLAKFGLEALTRLRAAHKELGDRAAQARADNVRLSAARDESDVALRQRGTIDREIETISSNAGSLASALAELSSFIDGNICPTCGRDFSEEANGTLNEHVQTKIRTLSRSADRLLTLGRSRSELQTIIERLDREIESLTARAVDTKVLAEIDRDVSAIDAAVTELDSLTEALREGGRLLGEDVAARRAFNDAQSRNVALSLARDTLNTFALSIGAPEIGDAESFETAANRLRLLINSQISGLERRLAMRREGVETIATLRTILTRRKEIDTAIRTDMNGWQSAEDALQRAQDVRDQGIAIRNAVDTVRSAIIRREFNDRLNLVWRDLFVRLAPGEPFIPAFRIPPSSTQRLQPKLITEHRDGGDAGGTPGAMLSAGNLNTAALTLFIALHLSVLKELPWLILDDPVQSMDDVHIAHFAALLRTLSKEHSRQVVIAVHDRQLFDYLRLELSPAFPEDSLLTLELSRGPRRDTLCLHKRFSFKDESTLLAVA